MDTLINTVNVLVVDDELNNRIVLERMITQHIPFATDIYQAASVEEALLSIRNNHPKIVLLDIQMQNETGFDLLQQVPHFDFEVIFVTAHDNYAIKAFRFNAVDYLLKPVVVTELKEAMEKALKRLNNNHRSTQENINRAYQQLQHNKGMSNNITIATAEGFVVVPLSNIIYCQASSNYTVIYLQQQQKIISSQTLGYYEELLPNNNFFRAHRSYLLNLTHVKSYRKGEGGTIVMSNNDEIELARNRKANFFELFKG